ncbi:DnaD domain protein [Ornithinibacillus halophilus]|uniref:DnaD domain protein n=1 Tax=Ornithinibacillus halophilus TaxID=930117 RepID=UPI001F283066|nr:DnaD domain protein [Ornithinibacillus halophilus]
MERNKATWGYVKGILNAWAKKGIPYCGAAGSRGKEVFAGTKGWSWLWSTEKGPAIG